VKLTRGDFFGEEGVVDKVDTGRAKLVVHGVSSTKADGTEVPRVVDASKVQITKLNLADKRRQERLGEGR
jgi:large subunit ribosomal protein L24